MEKTRLNHSDREYMKMAMLKHEETFREQVYELHRLYQIQKTLMKDIVKPRRSLDLERPTEADDQIELPDKCRVSQIEDDDQSDLELTLGPRSYYQKKIKASEPAARVPSEHSGGRSFTSSSTGSSHVKGASLTAEDQSLSWGISNQDRLNSPPWFFQALSLNMT